jgi:hypothetical protein
MVATKEMRLGIRRPGMCNRVRWEIGSQPGGGWRRARRMRMRDRLGLTALPSRVMVSQSWPVMTGRRLPIMVGDDRSVVDDTLPQVDCLSMA